MKKLSFLIVFIFLFLLTGCTDNKKTTSLLDEIKERDKIIVGVKADSKPFGFIKNGVNKGFDIDIALSIAEKIFGSNPMEHIEFVPLKSQERISALNTKRVDIVVAAFSINEKRKSVVDFSTPYFIAGQALLVPNSSRIVSIEQLNNKSIAVVLGTTSEKTVRMLAPNAHSIGTLTYKEALNYLQNGTVQAILADDTLLYGLISGIRGYKILPKRYTQEFYAVGLRQGEENLSLKKTINFTLQDMQQSGKMNKIKEKWIPRNSIK